MLCPKCGNILDESETSCKNCGAKVKENTLNSISKGGGKTQTPTEQEKREVKEEQIRKAKEQEAILKAAEQNQVQAMSIEQNVGNTSVNQQEYYMLQQQIVNARKNNNITLAIVIGLIIIVSAFGAILLGKKINSTQVLTSTDKTPTITDSSSKTINNEEEQQPEAPKSESGSGSDAGTSNVGKTDVQLGNYTFSFPNNYQTELQDGMGISLDYYNKVQFVYTVMNNISYEDSVKGAEEFKKYLGEAEFAVSEYGEYTFSNRKWLIYNGILHDMNSLYAITKIDSNSTFQVTIYNLGSKNTNDLFVELTSIVDNAKNKNGGTIGGSNSSGGNGSGNNGSSGKSGSSGSKVTPSSGAVTA